ncbi:MAG: type II toxin-antitoxin system ParD family antitoxin [Alphaproteobacteria bacterium]|uniref:type II toxin-antitoxin system ParD family antitoxin n=1 Tax=Devosia sp. XGJD_8 TaxID=3391187 RepID=UPI001E0808A0|nr:type II toxin-antitoxin system ParD family antitoxin [Alphaproteobacteria bacterium]MBU1561341.1 type II toxin-antitoxin system ParD family antitoxin [Alphaproteobacteria bacterium]MBU2303885.1 type II toxin-antitoxin system ParD family antitoxin [Alphaproteobacteria bacterium]MBU2366514.1 type II toxin-antitoxin system ParD family antitoxin [Alphaproteobacteria bacterium]
MAISAELGENLEKVVNDLVENGRYNSKSEVLREGVRLVQEREARFQELAAKLQAGQDDIDAGRVTPAEEVFAELREIIEQVAKKAS